MRTDYKNRTNLGVGVGLLAIVSGPVMLAQYPTLVVIGAALTLGGMAVYLWGLCMYAKAKGRSWVWGLVGVFHLVGLLVLVCLRDHGRDPEGPRGFEVLPPAAAKRPPDKDIT